MSDLTIDIPTHTLPDGRKLITSQTVMEIGPPAFAFIKRFPEYFIYSDLHCGWLIEKEK